MDGNSSDCMAGGRRPGARAATLAARATVTRQLRRRGVRHVAAPELDPDDDVARLVSSGDVTGALRRLMQRHGAAVYRYCRQALGNAALADDVHQQVFIEAFRDLARFGRRSSMRTWLFAIARHRVLDAAKARTRAAARFEPTDMRDAPDPRPSPGESIDDARLREALVACLAELPGHARTAVLLRFQQGFSYEEMARICDEHAGTLQVRVARALRVLRASIEARLGAW